MTAIEPLKGRVRPDFKELWRYRELLYFLVLRNIKLRYKQTFVGVAWVIIQPLAAAVIFTVIFNRFIKLNSDGLPYALFVFCAFLPWNLFANSVGKAGEGLIINRSLITKVYFPRMLLPAAITIEYLLDFCISCAVFFLMLFLFGMRLGLNALLLPFFTLLAFFFTLGVAFWLSALNVRYRDVRYALPFLMQLWFYSSPVIYASGVVPRKWLPIYSLNPAVGIIDGFRWCLLGRAPTMPATLPVCAAVICVIFIAGINYFSRTEKTFADII